MDLLLEDVPLPIQSDSLAPIIKRPSDDYLVRVIRPTMQGAGQQFNRKLT